MVLCFPWQNRHRETIMCSFRPDLKDWFHPTQWKPLDSDAAFLTSGFQKRLLFIPHIWMGSAGWVAGGTVPSCPAARQGREVPWFPCPPSAPRWQASHTTCLALVSGAAPSPPQDRLTHQSTGSQESREGERRQGWVLFLFIQILN